jgi:hypothetical protein
VPVNQPERTAEEVDAGGDERRSDAVIVEHQRLDQVIGVAFVVRRVDQPVIADRVEDMMEVFVMAIDLPEDWIERMLQSPIDCVPLGCPQLVEISKDPIPRLVAASAVRPAQVLDDLFPGQDGLRDVIQH